MHHPVTFVQGYNSDVNRLTPMNQYRIAKKRFVDRDAIARKHFKEHPVDVHGMNACRVVNKAEARPGTVDERQGSAVVFVSCKRFTVDGPLDAELSTPPRVEPEHFCDWHAHTGLPLRHVRVGR